MHLTATGTEIRKAFILHPSSKPSPILVHDWKPKGFCKNLSRRLERVPPGITYSHPATIRAE
jgi:hypothetical protein